MDDGEKKEKLGKSWDTHYCIHAKYQGKEASFSILDGSVLSGELPVSKTRMVQAWIEIQRESLMADWDLAVNGQQPFQIDPLR